MKRAQGIKKRWEFLKENEDSSYTTPTLEYLLDYNYKQYLEMCIRCNEAPLFKGEWLSQEIKERV
jgi:hypothetical protein